MGKKIWYSKTLVYFWEKYHREYARLGLDSQSLYVKMKLDIEKIFPRRVYPEQNEREVLGTELWYTDFSKDTTHLYFIDQQLKTFLGNIRLSDLHGIKQFLKSHGEEKEVVVMKSKEFENVTLYNFAIHIPYEKHGYACSLGLDQDLKLTLLFNKGDTLSVIPEDHYEKLDHSSDKTEQFNAFTFRLAVNILAYINCFPDCIIDGVPSNLPDEYENRDGKTIALSEKISNGSINKTDGKMVAPHFRKGYFKLLKSDFYKNKKGQLVFVHETMVNGRAKTVYTSDKLSEFDHS